MKKAFVVVLVLLFFFTGFLSGMWFQSLQNREIPQVEVSEQNPQQTTVPSSSFETEVRVTDPIDVLSDAQQLGVSETASLGPNNIPAKLFVAPGYYLYIPENGWNLKQTSWSEYQDRQNFYAGVPCARWTTSTGSSELRVAYFPHSDMEQVRGKIIDFEPEYDLYEDKQGGIGGSHQNDGTFLEVQLIPSEDGVVMLAMRYPMEDLENSGYALHYMADSLVIYDSDML